MLAVLQLAKYVCVCVCARACARVRVCGVCSSLTGTQWHSGMIPDSLQRPHCCGAAGLIGGRPSSSCAGFLHTQSV